MAAAVTAVPGASRAFLGGVVSYATRVKREVLRIPDEVIRDHGVVSSECAAAMALGVRALLGSDFGVSTTGVAGPDQQNGLPVGTVFVGVAGPEGVRVERLDLSGSRSEIQHATVVQVLDLLGAVLRREEPVVG